MKKIDKKSKEEDFQRYVKTEMGYVIDTWWDEEGKDRRWLDLEKDGWKIDFDIYGKNIQMRMRDTIVATSDNKEELE